MAGLLEADLGADEEDFLVLAVGPACGPSLERDVLEIGVLLDVPRERPGESDGPGGDLARRLGGIDQPRVYARAGELELVDPRGELEGAPLPLRRVEGPQRPHAAERRLVAREQERRRPLPGRGL